MSSRDREAILRDCEHSQGKEGTRPVPEFAMGTLMLCSEGVHSGRLVLPCWLTAHCVQQYPDSVKARNVPYLSQVQLAIYAAHTQL